VGRDRGHTRDTGEGPGSFTACCIQGDPETVTLQTAMLRVLSALETAGVSGEGVSSRAPLTPRPSHSEIHTEFLLHTAV